MKPLRYDANGQLIPLTSGQRRRIERAHIHNMRKENGYRGEYVECELCGGHKHWCDCCQTYTSTCCVDYGTCMCS
jgi:hypothetical protein